MNWGVAFRSETRHSSSMYWPIVYQRADLRRCCHGVSISIRSAMRCLGHTSSRSAEASLDAMFAVNCREC
jgi:hypothetical protein